MIGTNARCRELQRLELVRANSRHRCLDFLLGNGEFVWSQFQVIMLCGEFHQCLVATRTHVGNDPGHRLVHVRRVLALQGQERTKPVLELRIRRVQKLRH